ncbi:MAG: methyltransferase domain-containing protein [Actinomycetota bacterium]
MPGPEEAAGAVLVSAMWSWSAFVLEPARAVRVASGKGPDPQLVAIADERGPGLGPMFSRTLTAPRLLSEATDHDHLVAEFDRLSEVYDSYVRPFSTPVFATAIDVLRPLITSDARLLDAGCGPGRELRAMARLVPDGEVVGVDLAAGMVVSAYEGARAAGLDNTAFVQSDVGDLPADFEGAFDGVYNCLAHHHYPEPAAAAAGILRCLRPGGWYAVIDPGPAWFVALSSTLSKLADPGWIGFHTPAEFAQLFGAAGFVNFSWHDLLPGFGLALGMRPAEGEANSGP